MLIIVPVLIIIGLSIKLNGAKGTEVELFEEQGLSFIAKTEGKEFLIYEEGKWEPKFLKGVNMGAAKPGYFPGSLAITKKEYLRWFQHISDMNADVIRIYTTMKPDFYNAFYEFNQKAEKPLYLMQGVWINEEDIATISDAYGESEKIKKAFIKDAKDLVDIIHGKAQLPEKPGFANGTYKKDISPYVIGWILGIEWDPYFVMNTNEQNPELNQYKGNYLYTEKASPFEVFLCEVGDQVLEYEANNYSMTRALSFSNWPTTDMLTHKNEPFDTEDIVEVNMEHIKSQGAFPAGLFASYHIYPYYPEFINYSVEYGDFRDEDGKINTYKAYLRDLIKEHTMPVLVAEFGIPASRGKAHDSKYSGYDQGRHDEAQQGEILVDLLNDIHDEGYCGGLVFTWQDEWFKRTWNTMDFDLSDQRPYWSNPQTNEQEFGVFAFDPGDKTSICYVDDDISDWKKDRPISETDNASIYVKSDEKYVYLLVKTEDFDFTKDSIYIPIDTIKDQGNTESKHENLKFEHAADFLIQIDGEDNSKILVDAYYDSFYFLYGEKLNMIDRNEEFSKKGTGIFNPMYHCLSKEIFLPQEEITVPFSQYETGALSLGNANPSHKDFNSLTDFSVTNGNIELRIPWQLLNVMDPSTKAIMGDLYEKQAIEAVGAEDFHIGVAVVKEGQASQEPIKMEAYSWQGWEQPTYHERLKPSYYILQEAFAALD